MTVAIPRNLEPMTTTSYTPVWSAAAQAQRGALPTAARKEVDEKFEKVLDDPHGVGNYDKVAHQWATYFGDNTGMIVYVIDDRTIRVVGLLIFLPSGQSS